MPLTKVDLMTQPQGFKPQRPIATCSCFASFYDTPGGWERMMSHITENNKNVHQWTFVSDLIITQESPEAEGTEVGAEGTVR